MLRMSTTMDRSFMETAASRALCGEEGQKEVRKSIKTIVSDLRICCLDRSSGWGRHLHVLADPHGSDRLQVLVSAAQHHTHGVVTFGDLRQGLGVAQRPPSAVGGGLTDTHTADSESLVTLTLRLSRSLVTWLP